MKRVSPGLEQLISHHLSLVRGRRVGLITNASGVLPDLTDARAALQSAGVRIVALFSPEHGLYGVEADGTAVASGRGPGGLPVYSLYGQTRRPTPEMLAELDVLLFDIQDVGTRFYTYVWTMNLALEAAGQAGLSFIVLDRPNPIGGEVIEGPVLEPAYSSFLGRHPLPIRHGLGDAGCFSTIPACRGFHPRQRFPGLLLRWSIQALAWSRALTYRRDGAPRCLFTWSAHHG